MSEALIDAGQGLIDAYDGGSSLGIEKAKAAWADAVADYDASAEPETEEDTGDPDGASDDEPASGDDASASDDDAPSFA